MMQDTLAHHGSLNSHGTFVPKIGWTIERLTTPNSSFSNPLHTSSDRNAGTA